MGVVGPAVLPAKATPWLVHSNVDAGVTVAATVGLVEGSKMGLADGAAVGALVGDRGSLEGGLDTVGTFETEGDTDCVGVQVGTPLGPSEGAKDGTPEGLTEGLAVGGKDGAAVTGIGAYVIDIDMDIICKSRSKCINLSKPNRECTSSSLTIRKPWYLPLECIRKVIGVFIIPQGTFPSKLLRVLWFLLSKGCVNVEALASSLLCKSRNRRSNHENENK